MTRGQAMRRLMVWWLLLPVPAVLLVSAQVIAGKYGSSGAQAWSWLLTQFAPVVALITAAVFANPSKAWLGSAIDLSKWRIAIGLSIAQTVAMLAILIAEPFASATILEMFDNTAAPLAVVQGLIVWAIGAVIFDGR